MVCIFICGCLWCRLGCFITSQVWEARMPVPVPRPPERELLDARAAQEEGDLAYLQLSGRMTRIKDHIYDVMRSGLVPKGTEEWQHLEDALREVRDGKVYRRRGATEGGRGGGRGGGGTGVVIRG
jgi:hypothetical protein